MSGPSPIETALVRHRLAEVARRSGIPLNTDQLTELLHQTAQLSA